MHSLTKEAKAPLRPESVAQGWAAFLPVVTESDKTDSPVEMRHALYQAENVIRAQEERIRALETMVMGDELTGVANRRGFNAAFERELSLARRDADHGGVLVMIDLDGFKSINDQHGHQAGDAYLCAVAHALREGVRGTDIIARVGGDEFAVLLTHIDEKDGAARLARLDQFLHGRSIIWNGKKLGLRASFGMAPYTGGDRMETVMRSADLRLYAHKARNDAKKKIK